MLENLCTLSLLCLVYQKMLCFFYFKKFIRLSGAIVYNLIYQLISFSLSGQYTLFTQYLVMSASMLWARMSTMNLLVSNYWSLWRKYESLWKNRAITTSCSFSIYLGWFLSSVRSDLCNNLSCEGCLWEASYRAPFSRQVRKDLLVFGWNCLEGEVMNNYKFKTNSIATVAKFFWWFNLDHSILNIISFIHKCL